MISALWELFSSVASAVFQVGGALVRVVFQLLGTLASAVVWPFRAAWALLFGDWHTLGPWTPLYLALCLLVALALGGLFAYTLWKRRRQP